MTDARLVTPTVRVLLEQEEADELLDMIVQTDNRDAVAWEMTRGKKQWPPFNEAPFLWSTFIAWSALRRTKETSLGLDAFLEVCVLARVVGQDGQDLDPAAATVDDMSVGPTTPDASA